MQGEAYSENTYLKHGSDFGFATAAFGQGIEMTPIQLARAFCIFPDGGVMPKPYVVDSIVHGLDQQTTKSKISSQIIMWWKKAMATALKFPDII